MLYAVAKASMEETGGGEGVEVLKNEAYEDGEPLLNGKFTKGQYTDKIYHLESKVPAMIRHVLYQWNIITCFMASYTIIIVQGDHSGQ